MIVIDPKAAQLVTLILAIETHLKFKGKMMLTRTATPKRMRELAKGITGVTYKRNELEKALTDLKAKHDESKQQVQHDQRIAC